MLDRKMNPTFLMTSTSSITMQSLGKIVQKAPAVGAKTWSSTATSLNLADIRQYKRSTLLHNITKLTETVHELSARDWAWPTGTLVRLAC